MGLLTLAGTGAIAVRYGVLPFHLRIPRLTDVVPPITLPLLLAWIPLPLAVAGIAAVDNLVAPLALPLDGERAIVILVAAATLLGASLAAFTQDDLRHTTGYLVIADAGILVLAAAALDPAAWGPTRTWVVVLAASKTALGAWAAVTEERFQTRSIPDLRGWMRRSPLLAAGLLVTIVATFGLPGWVAFNAREQIAGLAADGAGVVVLTLLGWLALPAYLRLVVVGAGRVTSKVDGAAPERFVRGARRSRRREERLPVEPDTAKAATVTDAAQAASASATPTAVTDAAQATGEVSLPVVPVVPATTGGSRLGSCAREGQCRCGDGGELGQLRRAVRATRRGGASDAARRPGTAA